VLRWLARRDYGRAELAARLRARGVAPDAIEPVLDEFVALGYLSDERYAHALVAQRVGRYGRRAIVHELKDRQIPHDVLQAAIAPLADRDETAEAAALRERRFGAPPRDERDKARQFRFLVSRGYAAGVALKVLRQSGVSIDDLDAG
jgi:regulatory protein